MENRSVALNAIGFKEFIYKMSGRKFCRIWGEWPFNLCGFKAIIKQAVFDIKLTARKLKDKLGYKNFGQMFNTGGVGECRGITGAAQILNQPIITVAYNGDKIYAYQLALPGCDYEMFFPMPVYENLNEKWEDVIRKAGSLSGCKEREDKFIEVLGEIVGHNDESHHITFYDALLELQRDTRTIIMTSEVNKNGFPKTGIFPWSIPHFNAAVSEELDQARQHFNEK
ncbi:MAG: hypothetical protein LBI56_01960 [Puniceicoccales bacterium]|jgi:hypothetical protein|nr:hypothetical protein [Puniceicoccales bacterium]